MLGIGDMEGMFPVGIFMPFMSAQQSFEWAAGELA
jgi:hypothetical protein